MIAVLLLKKVLWLWLSCTLIFLSIYPAWFCSCVSQAGVATSDTPTEERSCRREGKLTIDVCTSGLVYCLDLSKQRTYCVYCVS